MDLRTWLTGSGRVLNAGRMLIAAAGRGSNGLLSVRCNDPDLSSPGWGEVQVSRANWAERVLTPIEVPKAARKWSSTDARKRLFSRVTREPGELLVARRECLELAIT